MHKPHSSRPARACDPTLDMAITGLMAALVFTGTYFFKIPTAFGYTHLGDCMIILTVCLFGHPQGKLAGAIGAWTFRLHRRIRRLGPAYHCLKGRLGADHGTHHVPAAAPF